MKKNESSSTAAKTTIKTGFLFGLGLGAAQFAIALSTNLITQLIAYFAS